MKIVDEIYIKGPNGYEPIQFGIPNTEKEVNQSFHFRYQNYLKHNYIYENPEEIDKDQYDKEGLSTYFIAVFRGAIIGFVRLINSEYLPTQKDCFDFDEPECIAKIDRTKRLEVGRLIVSYDRTYGFPRHLIMLGLIQCISKHAEDQGLLGGYSFIKEKLQKKLESLGFPFHKVSKYNLKYNQKTLEKYFNDPQDKVIPIYFISDEVRAYLDKVFGNKLIFKRKKGKLLLRNMVIWDAFRKIRRRFNAK